MPQVIIYANDSGHVSLCIPTGEIPIEDVLVKDCPPGAIIVDTADLPPLNDSLFNAWTLQNDGTVFIDLQEAKALRTRQIYDAARATLPARQANDAMGLPNTPSNAEWQSALSDATQAVQMAGTVDQVRDVVYP